MGSTLIFKCVDFKQITMKLLLLLPGSSLYATPPVCVKLYTWITTALDRKFKNQLLQQKSEKNWWVFHHIDQQLCALPDGWGRCSAKDYSENTPSLQSQIPDRHSSAALKCYPWVRGRLPCGCLRQDFTNSDASTAAICKHVESAASGRLMYYVLMPLMSRAAMYCSSGSFQVVIRTSHVYNAL